MDIRESSPIEQNDKIKTLVDEIKTKDINEISHFSKALFATQTAKEALASHEISLQECLDFANSLIDYNAVPVIIGTPDRKPFPIKSIISARPAMIERTRQFVAQANAGVDFDQQCQKIKIQAQSLYDWLRSQDDSAININSPEEIINEAFKKAKSNELVRALSPNLIQDDETLRKKNEDLDYFIKLNFSNFVVGQDFLAFLQKNYQSE